MAEKIVLCNESDLVSVADAIREKAGLEDNLTFPAGFAEAIAGFEAGGGFEVSYGIITPASTLTTLTWEHGLSDAPSYVLLFIPVGYTVNTQTTTLRSYYKKISASNEDYIDPYYDVYRTRNNTAYMYHESSLSPNEVPFKVTDKDVTACKCRFGQTSVASFMAGKPYHWICISGDIVFPRK